MSGAELAIVDDTAPVVKKRDSPWRQQACPELLSGLKLADLGPDGFVLRTDGGRLLVVGGQPRGTLNGVYTLLEEKFGVRWFTPELEAVPRQPTARLPDLNEIQVPALENRDVFWREMMRDANFAAKHRLNGQHYDLEEKHGGAFTRYYPFVHSFDMLVPKACTKSTRNISRSSTASARTDTCSAA